MNVHHIGYYVEDIDEARQHFFWLGYTADSDCLYDEERRIYVQFLKNGAYRVELVAPADGCTLISKSMKKAGPLPYHICYECTDMEKAMNDLQEKGFLSIRPPQRASVLQNHPVAFLYSGTMGMIELLEI